jgi:hypothetical protein
VFRQMEVDAPIGMARLVAELDRLYSFPASL